MSMTEPLVRVAAPAVVPHPFGLFSVVSPGTPADSHWLAGAQWMSTACGELATTVDDCFSGSEDPVPAKVPTERDTVASARTVTVYASRVCSGGDAALIEPEVIGLLTNGEEFAVESYLWSLLELTSPTGDPVSPSVALALIEAQLGIGYHGTGVIHMNRGLAALLAPWLQRAGAQLQTITGTPVVAGSGYDVDISDAATVIYGTGRMVLYRDSMENLSGWNRSINDYLAISERTYLVGWDCFVAGIQVNLQEVPPI